jgi:hypothetical protein
MSDRIYASVFYIALIVGSSWVAVTVGEALTRVALTKLSLVEPSEARPTRVDTVLAAQERRAEPDKAAKPLVPEPSAVSIGALAKAMDDAEQPAVQAVNEIAEANNEVPPAPAVIPEAVKPRVAGWSRRIPKRDLTAAEPESSARIIMRSLRAEM